MAKLQFIRNLSIKNKMTLVILFIAFAVNSIGFIFITFWDIRRLKSETEAQLSLNATLIGDYCIVPLVFEDKQQASSAISRLKFVPSVDEGYLLDSSGNLFASYPDSLMSMSFKLPDLNEKASFKNGRFYIVESIYFEEKLIGKLYVKANSKLLIIQNHKLVLILALDFLIMLIISYVLAVRFQKLITSPILKLADLTASISETQDFTVQLEHYGNDEVGFLYQQFNNLLSQILKRQKERDKAEKEIAFLAQVLKNINEFVSITDLEDNLIFVNQAWVKMFGYTEAEAIGKNIKLIVSPNNSPEVVAGILPATLKGGWQGEVLNIKKDGTEFPVMLFTTIIYDNANQPMALAGISSDITERKKIEKELIKHRDHLEELVNDRTEKLRSVMEETRDLYENAPCGYHSIDKNGIFVRINNTELKWLGYSREEVLNKLSFINIIKPEAVVKYKEYFPLLIKQGAISNLEFEFIRKDGSIFFVSLNVSAIYDSDGNFLMSRCTLFDITDRKRIEVELSKAIEAADAANKAKSEFLANMSHEIRTPMNAVIGYADLLSPLVKDDLQRTYLTSIITSGKSLLTLINDILDLSKIEAGKLELQFEYIDVLNFFTELENIFSFKIAEKSLEFILDVASGTPKGLCVDEIRLRQIFVNLIGNAIKFTERGYIKINVWAENPQILEYSEQKVEEFIDLSIEVEDTGIGISKEDQKIIFDSFQQQDGQRTKKYGGTGLGLTITKKLVDLMNGTITVESELNKGTKFKILIPDVHFIRDFERIDQKLFIDTKRVVFEPATILVVDDVEHNRKFLSDALKETNLRIIEADNGKTGFRLAKESNPDLIIADIRMPVMDGFELLSVLKRNKKLKHIPVMAYSASVMKSQREKIIESDFAGFIMKPVQIAELYIELMNHLPHQVLEDEKEQEALILENELFDQGLKDPAGLIEKLENEVKNQWNNFDRKQPINEVKDFGEILVDLGKKHQSKLVTDYGYDLKRAANTFNIGVILDLLKRYPRLIEKLKNNNNQHVEKE